MQVADHRHRRLLRARRERPCRRRAPDKRDELASLQPIQMHPLPSQGRQDSGLASCKSGACRNARFRLGLPPLMGWSGRAPALPAKMLARGTEDKEHVMSQKLNSEI